MIPKLLIAGLLLSVLNCSGGFVCPDKEPQIMPNQQTGYLDAKRGQMFYWLVRAKQNPETAPVVLWLNGGPGSSSLLGFLYEQGPYIVTPALTVEANPFSWNDKVNMLYIDQPLGTGFSIPNAGVQVLDEKGVATDMREALTDFFNQKFPEFSGRDFYIFGESFAGSYVPWITTELLNSKPTGIKLKGIAIGDGTVDMLANWETTADYAFKRGLISQSEREFALNNLLPACREQVLKYRETNVFMSPVYCQIMEDFLLRAANVQNVYDYREERQYAFDVAACYLNKPQVQKALGVDRTWSQDNDTVFLNLTNQADKPTVCEIQDIIKKIRVLIYTGNQDFLINYLGTEKWFSEMTQGKYTSCNNSQTIAMSAEVPWTMGQEIAGTIQKGNSDNLWFVKIDNAGHLVPKNQPRVAKHLLEQFLSP